MVTLEYKYNLEFYMLKIISFIATLLVLSSCVETAVVGAVGTAGTVISQERSMGRALDDATIFWKIKTAYTKADAYDLLTGINVEVIEARVYLTGKVPDSKTRVEAVTLAWEPNGVKEVVNEIIVTEDKSIVTGLKNKWLKTKISSKLLFTGGVRSLNYSVETINGVVYLMGISQTQDALDKAIDAVSEVDGVTKIINHVRVRDLPYINE